MARTSKPKRPGKLTIGDAHARATRGPHKDGSGRWYWQAVCYRDGAQVTVWTGWATPAEAMRDVAAVVATGTHDQPQERAEIVTARDLLECWAATKLDNPRLSPHTIRGYQYNARRLASLLDAVRLDRVTADTLERYANDRARDGAASGTIAVEQSVWRMAWTWGSEIGVCPSRRAPSARVKVAPTNNRRTPTRGEVAAVVDQLDGWPRVAVLLLHTTGARIGEVAQLRWQDLDLDTGEITFPKGKTASRGFPLPAHVVDLLLTWKATQVSDGGSWLLGTIPLTVTGGLRSRHLPRACAAAGVKPFTAHGLRRAAVDALLRAGVDVGTASSLLGHSPKVMLEHYRRATDDDRRKAVAAAAMGALPAGKVLPLDGVVKGAH